MYKLKNVKNTHGGVLLFVKTSATKSNTPSSVFFTFIKFYKWYRIAQCITYKKIKICNKSTRTRLLHHTNFFVVLTWSTSKKKSLDMTWSSGNVTHIPYLYHQLQTKLHLDMLHTIFDQWKLLQTLLKAENKIET